LKHEAKLVDHLSKEIITQTNNLMIFRSRINFAVFIGPFVLLGSMLYSGHGLPRVEHQWLLLTIIVLSYLTMGWTCASIEIHIWKQCNRWRALIADLADEKITTVTPENLEFKEKLRLGYLVVYFVMAAAFICVLIVASRIVPQSSVSP
jgi:hypothetical protein